VIIKGRLHTGPSIIDRENQGSFSLIITKVTTSLLSNSADDSPDQTVYRIKKFIVLTQPN
jgi:hypothetical protein